MSYPDPHESDWSFRSDSFRQFLIGTSPDTRSLVPAVRGFFFATGSLDETAVVEADDLAIVQTIRAASRFEAQAKLLRQAAERPPVGAPQEQYDEQSAITGSLPVIPPKGA